MGVIGAIGGGILAVAGFALLFVGLYLFLLQAGLSPAASVVVTGTVLLVFGGSLIWGMRAMMR